MAAKLPDPAMTPAAVGGTGRRAIRVTQAARPPPSAISGASGPSTAPRLRVASAATITPGSWAGVGAPLVLSPSAGSCPPVPGSQRMASAVSSPDRATSGTGHHSGSAWNPRPCGRLANSQCWSLLTRARKK